MTETPDPSRVVGLLLAGGAGRRMGVPKALLTSGGRPWIERSVDALREGGCGRVVAILGAGHDQALRLLPADVEAVHASRWELGIGESLRAGLHHLAGSGEQAAVVTLVDLPDVDGAVVARVLAAWSTHEDPAHALARATYRGRPGHPVVLGRGHWEPVLGALSGDVGAQRYLTREDVRRSVDNVECADLATGRDIDRPSDAPVEGGSA